MHAKTPLPLIIACLVGLAVVPAAPSLATTPPAVWSLLRDDDGIKVYRRDRAPSALREFRGVGIVHASIPKLVALLADPSKMPQWTDNCLRAELAEKNFTDTDFSKNINDYFEIVYATNRVPWPLKYRDYIIKSSMHVSSPQPGQPAHLVISSHTVQHDKYPETSEFVRIPTMNITIDMQPTGKDGAATLIDFSVVVDPGGMVPDMIVNAVSKSLPYRTLKNIAKLAEATDYNKNVEKLVAYQYEKAQAAAKKQ